jgi:hypothetical protein
MDPSILLPLLTALCAARTTIRSDNTEASWASYNAAEDAIRSTLTHPDDVTTETAAEALEKVWETMRTISTLEIAAGDASARLEKVKTLSMTNNRFQKAAKKQAKTAAAVDAAYTQLDEYQHIYKTLLRCVPEFITWNDDHLVALTTEGLTHVNAEKSCTLRWSEFPSSDHLRIRWVSFPDKGYYDEDGSPVVYHDEEVEATLPHDGHTHALVFTVESPKSYGVGFNTCLKIVTYYTHSKMYDAAEDIRRSYTGLRNAIRERICGAKPPLDY